MANALKIQNTKFNPLGLIPNPSPKEKGFTFRFNFKFSLHLLANPMKFNATEFKCTSPSSLERDLG